MFEPWSSKNNNELRQKGPRPTWPAGGNKTILRRNRSPPRLCCDSLRDRHCPAEAFIPGKKQQWCLIFSGDLRTFSHGERSRVFRLWILKMRRRTEVWFFSLSRRFQVWEVQKECHSALVSWCCLCSLVIVALIDLFLNEHLPDKDERDRSHNATFHLMSHWHVAKEKKNSKSKTT